jgi:hypothetical protein
MKKRDLKEKAAELLKNDLRPEDQQEIIRDLAAEGISREEIDSMGQLYSELDNAFNSKPSERMDKMFYSMLENESSQNGKQEHNYFILKYRHAWMLVAAGIALFILGWFSASQVKVSTSSGKDQIAGLTNEVKGLREMLVQTMLSQSSAAERIKAVNMIKEFPAADSRIIGDLFRTLDTDENDNVRLLALDALMKYADDKEVRRQLISSIPLQTSPIIQLRLTEIMTALKEKDAVPEFNRLLDDASLNYSVRNKIQEAVGILL